MGASAEFSRNNLETVLAEKDNLRFLQREFITGQLDSNQQQLLLSIFPQDRVVQYSPDYRPEEASPNTVYSNELLTMFSPYEFGDEGYPLIFKLLCTAQSPEEYRNLLQGVKLIETGLELPYLTNTRYQVASPSRGEVIESGRPTLSTAQLSREAEWIYGEMCDYLGEMGRVMTDVRAERLGMKYFHPGSELYEKYKHAYAELLPFLMLTTDHDYMLRDFFLTSIRYCDLESPDDPLVLCGREATFWRFVDGSWMGLPTAREELLTGSETTPKADKDSGVVYETPVEAELRRQNASLRSRLAEAEGKIDNLEEENHTLKFENGKQDLEIMRLRSRVYELEALQLLNKVNKMSNPTTAKVTVDTFLLGNGAPRDYLESLVKGSKHNKLKETVRRLRIQAGRAFHPDNSINPNQELLQDINAFLDRILQGKL